MNLTIGVFYSCPLCGLKDIEVRVPARETEDVLVWMEKTMIVALGADHLQRSSNCHPKELKEIKIPMTGADRVGGAPVQ